MKKNYNDLIIIEDQDHQGSSDGNATQDVVVVAKETQGPSINVMSVYD